MNATIQTKKELRAAKERAEADKAKLKSLNEEIEALKAEAKVSEEHISTLDGLLITADEKTAAANDATVKADDARNEATKLTEAANLQAQEAVEKIAEVSKERDAAREGCATLQEKLDVLGLPQTGDPNPAPEGDDNPPSNPEGDDNPSPDPKGDDVVDLKGGPQAGATPPKGFVVKSAGGQYVCACAKNTYRGGTLVDAILLPTREKAKTFLDEDLKNANIVFQSGWDVVGL